MNRLLQTLMHTYSEESTCSQRRSKRMPFELKCAYRSIALCACPIRRKELQSRAWQLRLRWIQEQRLCQSKRHIDKGGVVCKSKKLHKIQSLRFSVDSASADPQLCCEKAATRFAERWGSKDLQQRMNVLNFVFDA